MATQIMKNNINPIEYFTILGLNEIVKYLNLYIQDQDYGVEFTWNMFNEDKENFYDYIKTHYDLQIMSQVIYEEIIEFILRVKVEGERTSKQLSQTLETSNEDSSFDRTLRDYYLLVMNNQSLNINQKMKIIYMDLVLPQLTHFDSKEHVDGFTVSYTYGSPYVNEKTERMFTCGRFPICTINTNPSNDSVSRCNFIMIKIKDELIILSGWSCAGTRCISREYEEEEQYVGNKSLMRFNENETFIINVGHESFSETITFNPKTCVVCLENKCEIRGSCNHATLCSECYEVYKENSDIVKCPICRKVYNNDKFSQCVRTFIK